MRGTGIVNGAEVAIGRRRRRVAAKAVNVIVIDEGREVRVKIGTGKENDEAVVAIEIGSVIEVTGIRKGVEVGKGIEDTVRVPEKGIVTRDGVEVDQKNVGGLEHRLASDLDLEGGAPEPLRRRTLL